MKTENNLEEDRLTKPAATRVGCSVFVAIVGVALDSESPSIADWVYAANRQDLGEGRW